MDRASRSRLAAGIFLILLGAWFLAVRFIPGLEVWANMTNSWPMIVIGVGVLLLFLGLLTGAPGMAIPACIVGGIGGLLFYQNATGDWGSWAYAWALIPGFVGVGVLLNGLLEGRFRSAIGGGLWLIFISVVLFMIFGSLLGGLPLFGSYWPVLVIIAGVWMLLRAFWARR